MNPAELKKIIESVLMAAGRPLGLNELMKFFGEDLDRKQVREAIDALRQDYESRGIELTEVASGYRIQVRQEMEPWVSRLWDERPPRYSRALLETLSLIAYRQPITRAEIEDVRGVNVSTSIMKTLLEREWVRVVGHRDVPGRPAMYATTKLFLDYFNLKNLEELPTLAELRDIDSINVQLDLEEPEDGEATVSAGDLAVGSHEDSDAAEEVDPATLH